MGGKVSSKMAAPVGRVIQVRLAKWPLNCTTAKFATQVVRPHAPLIKFPNREGVPKPNAQEALKSLAVDLPQQSPPSFRPAAASPAGPGGPDTLASIQLLPQRYRRRAVTLEEMDYIQRGGPENREGVPMPYAQEALKSLAVGLPQQSPPSFRPAAAPPAGPGGPDTLASIQLLPQRYRRRAVALEEIDYIQCGGPE